MPTPLSTEQALAALRARIRRAREDLGLSQSDLARRLGWKASKVSKIEGDRQPVTVPEALALEDTLGVDILSSLVRSEHGASDFPRTTPSPHHVLGPAEVDPMVFDSNMLLQEQVAPREPSKPLFPLNEKYFPMTKAVKIIDGAQVPTACLGDQNVDDESLLPEIQKWLRKVRKQFDLRKAKLDGLRLLPALRAADLRMLQRPQPVLKGPASPHLKTRLRGGWMTTPEARLVVDPISLKVTVAAEPLLVLYPLRLIFVDVPSYADPETGDDGLAEREQHVFRLAGLLCSTWAQEWMHSSGKLWFSSNSGPFRDVPVPAKLWHRGDREGRQVEKLARDIWDSKAKNTKLATAKKSLDKIVVGLMEGLNPCW